MMNMLKQAQNKFPNMQICIPLTNSVFEYCMKFDGCSKGNPGPSGAGAVIYCNNKEIWADSMFVGQKETNNVAEYNGLLLGLQKAIDMDIRELFVQGDSLLVIKQMRGEYKVSSPNILGLYSRAKLFEEKFTRIEYQHIYRIENKRADALSNEGLEKATMYAKAQLFCKSDVDPSLVPYFNKNV